MPFTFVGLAAIAQGGACAGTLPSLKDAPFLIPRPQFTPHLSQPPLYPPFVGIQIFRWSDHSQEAM